MGNWGVVKKNTGPPQTGVPGGNLVCFNPRGIRRSIPQPGLLSKEAVGGPRPPLKSAEDERGLERVRISNYAIQ